MYMPVLAPPYLGCQHFSANYLFIKSPMWNSLLFTSPTIKSCPIKLFVHFIYYFSINIVCLYYPKSCQSFIWIFEMKRVRLMGTWFYNIYILGFPDGSDSKGTAWDIGDLGLSPGLGKSLEKGKATHSRIPAWRIPWTERPGRLQSKEWDTTED